MKIPEKFYKGSKHPTARTVGKLKAILAELPDSLPVEASFGEAVKLIVYNHGQSDQHLEIEAHES